MSFTPNLTDPRTKAKTLAKIQRACGWAFATCKSETVISKVKIDKVLGQSSHPLGNYLRSKLLKCTNSHTQFFSDAPGKKGIAKKYVLNEAGYRELMEVLNGGIPLPADFVPGIQHGVVRDCVDKFLEDAIAKHSEELKTLAFDLNETPNCRRLFHGLQGMRREVKDILWSNRLPFNYDVRSCAPTLLYQNAKQLGLKLECLAINTMLADPQLFREELAARTGVTYKQAKVIVNALFCGAVLGRSAKYQLFREIGYSYPIMETLRADPWLEQLQLEIKAIWKQIGEVGQLPRKKDKRGRWLPISYKVKWAHYFDLERMVLDETMTFLKERSIPFFPEHDGFRTQVAIDVAQLQKHISDALDFQIEFSHEGPANPVSTMVVCKQTTSGHLALIASDAALNVPVLASSSSSAPGLNNHLFFPIACNGEPNERACEVPEESRRSQEVKPIHYHRI